MSTTYGDISPRTAGYAHRQLLKRAIPHLVIELFGQTRPLPRRNSKQMIFRRYEALDPTPNPLTEGVTPNAKSLNKTDIPVTLTQYGDRIQISDVIQDTHEDPVLNEAVEILGEQAPQMIEAVRFGAIKAGSNVFFANGTSRGAVNATVSLNAQRRVTRALKRQNARKITSVLRSSPNYGTQAVAPGFIGLSHPDCESDIRNLPGFVPVENYGSMTPYPSEIGKCEDVRYVSSTVFEAWEDAGGDPATNGVLSSSGTQADVYPIIYVARDAYAIVPLRGANSLTPMVVNPKPSDSDPLAQRGHAGWKAMQAAVILQDLWMARLEVAVGDLEE